MDKFRRVLIEIIGALLRVAIAAVLIILFICLLLWLGFSTGGDSKRAIAFRQNIIDHLPKAKTSQADVVLDFSKLTNFDWDTLWVFPGYSDYKRIEHLTHYSPNLLCDGQVDEFDELLVFTLKDKPVEHLTLKRDTLDFVDFRDEASYSKKQSKFIVRFERQQNACDVYSCKPLSEGN